MQSDISKFFLTQICLYFGQFENAQLAAKMHFRHTIHFSAAEIVVVILLHVKANFTLFQYDVLSLIRA